LKKNFAFSILGVMKKILISLLLLISPAAFAELPHTDFARMDYLVDLAGEYTIIGEQCAVNSENVALSIYELAQSVGASQEQLDELAKTYKASYLKHQSTYYRTRCGGFLKARGKWIGGEIKGVLAKHYTP
jgi:hypothetical protein